MDNRLAAIDTRLAVLIMMLAGLYAVMVPAACGVSQTASHGSGGGSCGGSRQRRRLTNGGCIAR